MNPTRLRRGLGAALAGALAATTAGIALVPGAEATSRHDRAYGLTANGVLVTFDLDRPGRASAVGKVTGLAGQELVGIDVRPANNRLYGVGRQGGLFLINPKTAKAQRVTTLDVKLRGTSFGVDVNPAADALRIVSDRGQNLRHTFEGHVTVADATLNIPDQSPRVRGIVGAAYTNNDTDESTGTALYDLNAAKDIVQLQVPANAGILTTQGPLSTGTSDRAGFDILSTKRQGRTVANTGYATLGGSKGYALYTVDLTTGRTAKVGDFRQKVVELAVIH